MFRTAACRAPHFKPSVIRPLHSVTRSSVASLSACSRVRSGKTTSTLHSPHTRTFVRMRSTAQPRRIYPDATHEGIDSKTPTIFSFFEKVTGTWQYIISDPKTRQALIIDPVLDYDPASGTISTNSADDLLSFIKDHGLNVTHILETHAHADHLTSSRYLKSQLNGTPLIGIGGRITQVQQTFAPVYGYDNSDIFTKTFDIYWKDDEEFKLGDYTCRVVHLPGHTPDHVGYIFGSAVFTGDSIFNPDVGSARADFPGGNAEDLYCSMKRLLSLPSDTLLFVGHDYPPNNAREPVAGTAVREHQAVWNGKDEQSFVQWRKNRDAMLGSPRLLHPSLQVNILGGRLPPKDDRGRRWLKTPVRAPRWPAED